MARKFYTLNDNWLAEDRRKLLAFARDLLNSDYAGHRLTFVQFAQAPHFNHPSASTTLSTFRAARIRQEARGSLRSYRRNYGLKCRGGFALTDGPMLALDQPTA